MSKNTRTQFSVVFPKTKKKKKKKHDIIIMEDERLTWTLVLLSLWKCPFKRHTQQHTNKTVQTPQQNTRCTVLE